MIREIRLPLAVTTLFILLAGSAADARGCFVAPDKTQTIAVTMSSGARAEVMVEFYKGSPDQEGSGACMASATIPLSQFPSSRVAARPSQLAAALREIADEWGVKECSIWISYENDTSDDLADHELCVMGSFAFDKGDYWSASSERNCWEPAEISLVEVD